MGKIRSFGYLA